MKLFFESKSNLKIILFIIVLLCWFQLFSVRQPDYQSFLLPWLSSIRNSNGLSVFSTSFSNYTASYITILWLFERLDFLSNGALGNLAVIKLAALFGSILCSIGVWSVLRALGWQRESSLTAAIGALLLPEMLLNGIGWAQADALYTAFLAFTVASMIREKPYLAVVCFSIAFSTKLQALWLAPLMAGWLLRRPQAILFGALMLPITYIIINGLYLIAGREWYDVFNIYLNQFSTFRSLSKNAPNFWFILEHYSDKTWRLQNYSNFLKFGLISSLIVASWIFIKAYRLPKHPGSQLLYLAGLCAILMPFLLPKMHERFFFAAGIFIYLFALIDRRYIIAVITFQISVLLAYSQYHDTFGLNSILGARTAGLLSVFFMTSTVYIMLKWLSNQVSYKTQI